jgi:hypothetical protein
MVTNAKQRNAAEERTTDDAQVERASRFVILYVTDEEVAIINVEAAAAHRQGFGLGLPRTGFT